MAELSDVLAEAKFDRYVTVEQRVQFIRLVSNIAELVPIVRPVRECRDPKDDRFLEVAPNGRAELIVTGDTDLLVRNPWRGIEILSPHDYMKR